jgi:hypothetical protein
MVGDLGRRKASLFFFRKPPRSLIDIIAFDSSRQKPAGHALSPRLLSHLDHSDSLEEHQEASPNGLAPLVPSGN